MIRHPDPRTATLAVLRGAFPAVTFGTKRLDDFAQGDVPALPYARVSCDGTFSRLRVSQRATVRVTVWAESDAAGYDLAANAHASLMAHEGNADVHGFGPLTGPLPTDDPDTGRPLCSFTVSARLRPRAT
ncbi:hypothetical protein GA0070616_4612 [Micromonospora nigra]|uniref:DUF3168 domain-containing protein n=1 Tax=Micromonospora nigra TaxID=145857 RepID=A0A1C6STZ9_9ACTN|nr:hypothetical protein [Micromonospora nigra]SCL33011.1 hypothetical protein GA0070616_4612 [Micromonospora nigra]